MRIPVLLGLIVWPSTFYAQNVGIGIPIPNFKLHVGIGTVRVEGAAASGGTVALSVGGYGEVQVDAFGNIGGRFVIKDNGSVGIGVPNPFEKLEVNGAVKADVFKYNTPKTYYQSISGTAFRGASSGDVTVAFFDGIYISTTPPAASRYMVAPVNLPHGATIVSVTVYYYDNSPTTDLRVDLVSFQNGVNTGAFLSTLISAGNPGEASFTDNTVSPSLVNMNSYSYSIEVSSTVTSWPGFDLKLRSVLITYTMPEF